VDAICPTDLVSVSALCPSAVVADTTLRPRYSHSQRGDFRNPLVVLFFADTRQGYLQYNEYIVYDAAQIRLKYLLMVKMS
jgi:hypothetical protein